MPGPKPKPAAARFATKVIKGDACWLWVRCTPCRTKGSRMTTLDLAAINLHAGLSALAGILLERIAALTVALAATQDPGEGYIDRMCREVAGKPDAALKLFVAAGCVAPVLDAEVQS